MLCATIVALTAALTLPGIGAGQAVESEAAVEDASLLQVGDRVVLLGDTAAERSALFGYLETMLRGGLPQLDLTVRNLGWSADTLALQPRPFNFGSVHEHLGRLRADVIVLCFGMSDSFAGLEGLDAFVADLEALVGALRGRRYGKAKPRIVLVAPIPHEDLGGALPDPAIHMRALTAYAAAIRKVAVAQDLHFVDLFAGAHALSSSGAGDPLTFNGIHASQYGAWALAHLFVESFGVSWPGWRSEADTEVGDARAEGARVTRARVGREVVALELEVPHLVPPPPPAGARAHASLALPDANLRVRGLAPGEYVLTVDGVEAARASARAWAGGVSFPDRAGAAAAEAVRALVLEKKRLFFQRWRPVNGEYVFGRRAEPFGVVNFPEERKTLDALIKKLDRSIAERIRAACTRSLRLTAAR